MSSHESRSLTLPLGKNTAEAKTKIPDETRDELDRVAHAAGMTFSELLREMCIVRAHGQDVLRTMYEKRLDVVARRGPGEGEP